MDGLSNYSTLHQLYYPEKARFMPRLIPLQEGKFAEKIAQEYRCLSGYFTTDCCTQSCKVPGDRPPTDYQVANADYPVSIPDPICVSKCSYRTK